MKCFCDFYFVMGFLYYMSEVSKATLYIDFFYKVGWLNQILTKSYIYGRNPF